MRAFPGFVSSADLLSGTGAGPPSLQGIGVRRVALCYTLAVREVHSQAAILSNLLSVFGSDRREMDRQSRFNRQLSKELSYLDTVNYKNLQRAGVIQR